MLVVNQGEVAVIKAFVGLPTLDTSGTEFKFGSIVRPGHRGIWQEPLRTGKYPINPRVLRGGDRADVHPHAQLVQRDERVAQPRRAARADRRARAVRASSSRSSCRCRSTCPTRRRRRSSRWSARCSTSSTRCCSPRSATTSATRCRTSPAVTFIETRMQVQVVRARARHRVPAALRGGDEGRLHPGRRSSRPSWSKVLTEREIANQEKATYEEMQRAQTSRIEMEKAKGTADMQGQLASAQVSVRDRAEPGAARARPRPRARRRTSSSPARPKRRRVEAIGLAEATATEALGVARATGFEAQKEALGETATALGRGGERGGRGPHHGRARGARHRRRRRASKGWPRRSCGRSAGTARAMAATAGPATEPAGDQSAAARADRRRAAAGRRDRGRRHRSRRDHRQRADTPGRALVVGDARTPPELVEIPAGPDRLAWVPLLELADEPAPLLEVHR